MAPLFGVDCDPIRAAHAYRSQLDVIFAKGNDASSSHANGSSQHIVDSSLLQAKEAIMPLHAYAADAHSEVLTSEATQPLLRRADTSLPRSRSPLRRTARANAACPPSHSCDSKSAAISMTAPFSQQITPHSTSVTITSSVLGPQRALSVLEGNNPNGSATIVGSLVQPNELH